MIPHIAVSLARRLEASGWMRQSREDLVFIRFSPHGPYLCLRCLIRESGRGVIFTRELGIGEPVLSALTSLVKGSLSGNLMTFLSRDMADLIGGAGNRPHAERWRAGEDAPAVIEAVAQDADEAFQSFSQSIPSISSIVREMENSPSNAGRSLILAVYYASVLEEPRSRQYLRESVMRTGGALPLAELRQSVARFCDVFGFGADMIGLVESRLSEEMKILPKEFRAMADVQMKSHGVGVRWLEP